MNIQLRSFKFRVTTLALVLVLSLVSIGAGPCTKEDRQKAIKESAEATKDLGGTTEDVAKAVGQAYERGLIDIRQKDRWASWLRKISTGGRKGLEILDAIVKAGLTELPADKELELNKLLDDEVVGPFLELISDIAKLSDDQSAAIRAAIAGLRTTILLLSKRIGRNDIELKLNSSEFRVATTPREMLARGPRLSFEFVVPNTQHPSPNTRRCDYA